MKCENAEKWILLTDSGELNDRRSKVLRSHLETCDSCRRFEKTLLFVKPVSEPLSEPPVATIQNIMREARRLNEPKSVKILYWKPAMAMAASVLIACGIFFAYSSLGPSQNHPLAFMETYILELDNEISRSAEANQSEDDLAFNFLMTYEET